MQDAANHHGWFQAMCRNQDGSVAWLDTFPNGMTTDGLTYAQGSAFAGLTQISTWYFLLIDSAGFTGLNATDTMAVHNGWAENQAYNEAVRPTWIYTTSGPTSSTSAVAVFTVNANGTMVGIAVSSDPTKGGTTGILWSTGQFTLPQKVVIGQIIELSYATSSIGG